MKKYFVIAALALVACASIVSCKSEEQKEREAAEKILENMK